MSKEKFSEQWQKIDEIVDFVENKAT